MGNTIGRQIIVPMTNKSGGSVAAGDVVILDTGNDEAFTTTTSAGSLNAAGIAQETIANNAVGRVLTGGYAALVNVNASVTRGDYGKTHTVAKQATDAGASRVAGTFCRFLIGGTTPSAFVYPVDLAGAALTDPTTTRGDLLTRDASALIRLAIGAAGTRLFSDGTDLSYKGFIGCKVYHSTTQAFTAGLDTHMLFDTEECDTNTFHFTSAANLTGTVAKTASSAAIVGTGTSFTTELTVNQVISIPGTAAEIGVVKLITDNTHLTLWQTMANTASGQTATRKNEYVAIPAGYGGYYRVTGKVNSPYDATTNPQVAARITKNGSIITGSGGGSYVTGTQDLSGTDNKPDSGPVSLAAGDYIGLKTYTANALTMGSASANESSTTLAIEFLGS